MVFSGEGLSTVIFAGNGTLPTSGPSAFLWVTSGKDFRVTRGPVVTSLPSSLLLPSPQLCELAATLEVSSAISSTLHNQGPKGRKENSWNSKELPRDQALHLQGIVSAPLVFSGPTRTRTALSQLRTPHLCLGTHSPSHFGVSSLKKL